MRVVKEKGWFKCPICGMECDIGYEVDKQECPPLENVTSVYGYYLVTMRKVICINCYELGGYRK